MCCPALRLSVPGLWNPDCLSPEKQRPESHALSNATCPGMRTVRVGESIFTVPQEYEMQEMVGKGAYGTVPDAIDVRNAKSTGVSVLKTLFETPKPGVT